MTAALMESYVLEWLQLGVRWLHMIAGIAWIGASFYFVWLNNNVKNPSPAGDGKSEPEGVANATPSGSESFDGELHAIHGGGFYRVQRYALAPKELPHDLHWFKWEAYTTWLSGISLLVLVYYLNPQVYLIDANVAKLESWVAISIGVGFLIAGWLVYDLLQRSPLGKSQLAFGAVFFSLVIAASYYLCHTFGGRAAYLHIGAMLGTIMVGNVFFTIIPSQRELVNAKTEGRLPNKKFAEAAKNRSLHNNYITLPVLFIMISNHYPMTFSHEYNWAILGAISLGGALIRHWFNLRGQGRAAPWLWVMSVVVFIAVIVLTAPKRSVALRAPQGDATTVAFAEVDTIIGKHCRGCHAEKPTDAVFKIAPNGVKYDTPQQISAMAVKIRQRAVETNSMPFGNKTNMTQAERELLGRWIDQGAKVE
ncbi:protein of unknown function DUF989 [Turneriella parva DSM 21527]|uniref:Urate oxidase N-terminal domain-containing protein n=2 Tax=Turneriella TaxID=338321 RepID=I4B3T0_TURPD|nr:protein of unknown function DUF989 [Turneriella parva DSM 21527]